MRWVALLLFIGGCYKEHTFHDCELSCTNELGCPSGLSCLDGMCRESGHTGTCSAPGADGMVDSPVDTPMLADTDGDTVPDAQDNCPTKANRDQGDEDRDMIGDVCDVCPISQNNTDTDHDGVGDDCDPDNSVQNHIALFEGFNTAPTAGAPFGGGQWTYANGTATADSNGTLGYAWDGSSFGGQSKVFTSVTINANHGTPAYAGTVMAVDTNTVMGAACGNWTGASGNTEFAVIDVGGMVDLSPAPGSIFSLGQDYAITEQALNNTFKCDRGSQFQTSGSPPSGGQSLGLVVHSAQATFDYVLVVSN